MTTQVLNGYFTKLEDLSVREEKFKLFGDLEDILLQRQHGSSDVTGFDWTKFKCFETPPKELPFFSKLHCYIEVRQKNGPVLTSILSYSCFYGFTHYVVWSIRIAQNSHQTTELVRCSWMLQSKA
jgi:hypothetical protein